MLGGLAIPYGRTAADLAATIDGLDDATLAGPRAVAERQAALDWAPAAEATWALLDRWPPTPRPGGAVSDRLASAAGIAGRERSVRRAVAPCWRWRWG